MAIGDAEALLFYDGPDAVDVTLGPVVTVGILTRARERTEIDPGSNLMVQQSQDVLKFVTSELPLIARQQQLVTADGDGSTTWVVRELRVLNRNETEAVLVKAD